MSGVQNPYYYNYEEVAASATNQVLGGAGAAGDYIHRLVLTVSTVATATVSIKDGAGSALPILFGAATIVPGVYSIELNVMSQSGAWSVTTGAGVNVLAVGIFSA